MIDFLLNKDAMTINVPLTIIVAVIAVIIFVRLSIMAHKVIKNNLATIIFVLIFVAIIYSGVVDEKFFLVFYPLTFIFLLIALTIFILVRLFDKRKDDLMEEGLSPDIIAASMASLAIGLAHWLALAIILAKKLMKTKKS